MDDIIFSKFAKANSTELAERLKCMVGFRNVAIHEYQKLDMARVKRVVEKGANDLLEFGRILIRLKD